MAIHSSNFAWESQGQRQVSYSPRDCKESDMPEWLSTILSMNESMEGMELIGEHGTLGSVVHLQVIFLLHELWEGVKPGFSEGKLISLIAAAAKMFCFSMTFWYFKEACGKEHLGTPAIFSWIQIETLFKAKHNYEEKSSAKSGKCIPYKRCWGYLRIDNGVLSVLCHFCSKLWFGFSEHNLKYNSQTLFYCWKNV